MRTIAEQTQEPARLLKRAAAKQKILSLSALKQRPFRRVSDRFVAAFERVVEEHCATPAQASEFGEWLRVLTPSALRRLALYALLPAIERLDAAVHRHPGKKTLKHWT